jgi:hypothetical protein
MIRYKVFASALILTIMIVGSTPGIQAQLLAQPILIPKWPIPGGFLFAWDDSEDRKYNPPDLDPDCLGDQNNFMDCPYVDQTP